MDIMADLLVVVVYCLGVYTLFAVVAGLFEWWESRLRRRQNGWRYLPTPMNQGGRLRAGQRTDRSGDLSGVFSP